MLIILRLKERNFAKIENGYFACVSNGAKIKIWDLTNGNLKYSIDSSNDINYIIYSLISLDNGLLLSKSLTEIKIWGIWIIDCLSIK